MEIVEFLTACLDEDERIARGADPGPWKSESLGRHDQAAIKLAAPTSLIQFDGSRAAANGMHVSRHDPARVLREINAKRRIIDEIVPRMNQMDDQLEAEFGTPRSPEPYESGNLLRLLALPYSDRDGYQEEWAL